MANGYIEGNNRITVDIVDRAEELVGPGDIMTCLGVTYEPALNDAGTWSARFPANDPIMGRVLLKKHFLHFYVDGEIFCYGLAEKWDWGLDDDGQQILVLSGRDSLAELDETSMANWTDEDFDGNNTPFQLIVDYNEVNDYDRFTDARAWSLAKWDYSTDPFDDLFPITDMIIYGTTAGETALRILSRVAEHTGESFRLAQTGSFPDVDFQPVLPKRHIEWLGNTLTSSGVRAVGGAGDAVEAEDNPFVCFIQNLTERRDTSKMLTRIYPYGSGLGETRLDLSGLTAGVDITLPSGFTLDTATNTITNTTASTALGKTISRSIHFKDIRPLFNTDADILAAKIYLANAAIAYLQRNDDIDDNLEYDLEVLQLPAHAKVGMTIRVVWQDERRDIDTDFVLLAIRKSVGSNGERTYLLKVATHNQWRLRERYPSIAQMEEGEIFLGHPQIDGVGYWKSYKEIVGDDQVDHMAEVPFFFGAEVVTVIQALFRFKVDRALIGVKSYALAATDTDQNVAANTGGTDTANTGDESADVTGDVFPALQATGDESADVTAVPFPDSDTGNSSITETTGGPDATTGVISPPTYATGQNDIAHGGWETGPALPDATTGDGSIAGDPHQHDFAHTHSHTHTHPGTLVDHIHGTDHEHSMGHTHEFSHQHEFPHTHPMPHQHEFPHQHPMPHVHAAPLHVHGLPALTSTFGLERIAALNSYIIADLEYAINGGAFADLSVGIPTVGGYTEIDITSAVRNPAGLKRPYQENNIIQIRRKTAAGTGKMAQIRVELGIRVTQQSIVIYD